MKLVIGGRQFLKSVLWDYCITHFETEKLWIIDSLPLFDPYSVSRVNVAVARQLLLKIRIARPFTFYQLKDKVFSLIDLQDSTVIVSCMDAYEVKNVNENKAIFKMMNQVLQNLNCKVILGFKEKNEIFKGAIWEEQ